MQKKDIGLSICI